MKRKKTAQKVQSPKAPVRQPVMQGDAFVAFIREATSIGNEVEARRVFDREVGEYLTEKGLVDDFEAWRKARADKPAVER